MKSLLENTWFQRAEVVEFPQLKPKPVPKPVPKLIDTHPLFGKMLYLFMDVTNALYGVNLNKLNPKKLMEAFIAGGQVQTAMAAGSVLATYNPETRRPERQVPVWQSKAQIVPRP